MADRSRPFRVPALLILAAAPLSAQRPAIPIPPSDAPLVVTAVSVRRDLVQQAAQQLAIADRGKPVPAGLLGSLQKTVAGDKHQLDAAKRVLAQQVTSLGADGRTVIVVIGTPADSARVVESLAGVKRRIRVAFVNHDVADRASDNSVFKSGLAGSVTEASSNLWVYLPKTGAAGRPGPDRVLSAKLASPTLWNGIFAAAGDAIDVGQLKSLVGRRDGSPPPAPGATPTTPPVAAPTTAAEFAVGDVVVPKIANVRVLDRPATDAKVVGAAQRTDELVVTAAPENGFLKVEGAALAGWVSLVMVARR